MLFPMLHSQALCLLTPEQMPLGAAALIFPDSPGE
ncbi:hypothetical protein PANO111632_04970 [Paracoccus nototheniae]